MTEMTDADLLPSTEEEVQQAHPLSRWLLIGAVVILAIMVGLCGAWVYVNRHQDHQEIAEETSEETTEEAQPCFFDLRTDIREAEGVEVVIGEESDFDEEWDGIACGLVSQVTVGTNTTATVHVEWWGPEGDWSQLIEEASGTWEEGVYNLQTIPFPSGERMVNDTVQWVQVSPGGEVVLYEHDPHDPRFPGTTATLSCP